MAHSESDIREQKIITLFLLVLVLLGSAILVYGEIVNSDSLPILGTAIMLPTLLAFLFNVCVYLIGLERRPPSQTPPGGSP